MDDVEAEIYNKISLPDNETAKDGSRAGTPDFDSVSWTLVVDDADEGLATDIEIDTVHAAWDGEYLFIKITTEAAFDITDSTMGVIIDDVSTGSDPSYEAACSSSRTGTTNYGFTYKWIADTLWVSQAGDDTDYTDHIKVNDGHNGIQLACDKDELGFTLDLLNDKIRAVSTDGDINAFSDSSFWQFQNVPSNSLDDITDATALGIPEFSSLIMPISSVILIVGYNHRLKRKYSQRH